MGSILDEIASHKRQELVRLQAERPLAEVRAAARDTDDPADFGDALRGDDVALIAEIKKASPSQGVIREDFDPEHIAGTYAECGARALSVLTEEAYFQGCVAYLQTARRVSGLPVLRKDFIVDPYQIHESRLIGADAILLIAALMDGGQLEDFSGLCQDLGLSALVEVHTREELWRAGSVGAGLIGINNRDLRSFETSLDTTFSLVADAPSGVTIVSESGIHTRDDVVALGQAGVDAVLVGEALMREADIGPKVRELAGTG